PGTKAPVEFRLPGTVSAATRTGPLPLGPAEGAVP
ncbi:hypothetical protein GA0115235_11391, partial [Streptomyces sp. DpondAA-F4a]